jgi:fumarylacetoacetase
MFSIHNIPFGVASHPTIPQSPFLCSAINDNIINLAVCARKGLLDDPVLLGKEKAISVFSSTFLNDFMALGRPVWQSVRRKLQNMIKNDEIPKDSLFPIKEVKLHLPIQIGDYTDFYASKEHATNVGTMFRGKENALQPNW